MLYALLGLLGIGLIADIFDRDDDDDTIQGSDLTDYIEGSAEDYCILAYDGSDLVTGGADEDTIGGGNGDDYLAVADIHEADIYAEDLRATSGLVSTTLNADLETGEADTVFGGDGDDQIIIGGNGEATGGDGADIFGAGFWIDTGDTAVATDFELGTDTLVYLIDKSEPVPEVSFSESEDGDAEVLINDELKVLLSGIDAATLDRSDVVLQYL